MAEAEDVITDVARHATVYAQKLWRQYRPEDTPVTLTLADIAQRLDLLINSIFGESYPIRTAQPPARPTLLASVFRHSQAPFLQESIPATNGHAIWLPATLPTTDLPLARQIYRALALQQAMRIQRNSAQCYTQADNPLCADIYLLLETHSADRDLIKLLPGLRSPLQRLNQWVSSRRPSLSAFSETRRSLEQLYRQLLSGEKCLHFSSAEESLHEARKLTKQMPGFSLRSWSTQPLLKDWWTGELRCPPGQIDKIEMAANGAEDERENSPRSGRLPRRPEEREAQEDEDRPDNSSAWMVQGEESHPLAEDPLGLQRPVDRDDETNPDEFGDLLSELSEARLVTTPGQAKEVLISDDPPDAKAKLNHSPTREDAESVQYPEWDYRSQCYKQPGATVKLISTGLGSQNWVDQTLEEHRALVESIRRRFEMLRARRVLQRKQLDGDEIDLDAYITNRADFRAGNHFNEALYQTRRNQDRSLAITLLIDISGSTDGWVSAHRRVIDVEREALLLVCIALESMGEPYSVQAFSGNGVHAVHVQQIKSFNEHFSNQVALRISALEPERYTRVGAALRHTTTHLMQTAAEHKLLLLLSDGKPNDNDIYEGRYGVEDTRQAVIEAKMQGIRAFCLTIDRQAPNYLSGIFGQHNYAMLPKPELLPQVLLEWMKRLLV